MFYLEFDEKKKFTIMRDSRNPNRDLMYFPRDSELAIKWLVKLTLSIKKEINVKNIYD